MTDLKARLDIVRDKKAEEHVSQSFDGNSASIDWIEAAYNSGFDQCSSILLPMVLEMRETLKKLKSEFNGQSHYEDWEPIVDAPLKNLEQKIKDLEK